MSDVTKSTLDMLVRNATMAADSVAIGFVGTEAAKTRAVFKRGLASLFANGMIEAVDPELWSDWFMMDKRIEAED